MLEGIRVISFTHFLQGPSASQMLADMGAEVIKVEPPAGAFERNWSGPDAYLESTSVFFLLGNRNVRSIRADLKDPLWKQAIRELVATADVLIESFRPGAMERLGFGWNEVHALNPSLVYCSLSGYGPDGPYRDRPGQDVLLQSMSGLAAGTGTGDQPPTPTGASIIDQHGATLGALGILAALHGRERTGEGTLVESNLLGAALDLQVEPLSYHLNGFAGERSRSNVSSAFYKAPYGVFATADGYVTLSLNSLSALSALFDDPWFASIGEENSYARRDDITDRIADHLRQLSSNVWEEAFSAHRIWFAPVHDYTAVESDPQVVHNRAIIEFEHPDAGPVRTLGHPITYNGKRPEVRSTPPRLGQDTEAVLTELGLDEETIESLIKETAS